VGKEDGRAEEKEEVLVDDPEEIEGKVEDKSEDAATQTNLGDSINPEETVVAPSATPLDALSSPQDPTSEQLEPPLPKTLPATTTTPASEQADKPSDAETQDDVEYQQENDVAQEPKSVQTEVAAVTSDSVGTGLVQHSNEFVADQAQGDTQAKDPKMVEMGEPDMQTQSVGEEKGIEVEIEPRDVELPETPAREDTTSVDEMDVGKEPEAETREVEQQEEAMQDKGESDGTSKTDVERANGQQAAAKDETMTSMLSSSSSLTSPSKAPSNEHEDEDVAATKQSKATKTPKSTTTTPLRQQKTGGGLPLPKPSTPIVRVTKGSAPPSSFNRSPPASTSTKTESKPSTPFAHNRIPRKSLTPSQSSATPLRPSHTGSTSTSSPSTTTPLRPHHTGSVTPLRPQATGTRAIERSPLYAPTASSLAKTKQRVAAASPGSVGTKSKTGSIGRAGGARKESVGSGSDGSPAMRSRVVSNGSAASSGIARQRVGSED